MFCSIKQIDYTEFFTPLEEQIINSRIPYTGALELTYRCNLSCRHCYCNLPVDDPRKSEELSTVETMRILDEAADTGCLWLLMTGGEIMVRKDFPAIYVHALRKGMFVEVFTNATLINEKIAALFAEFRPLGIDISIYGSNPSLHDRITRVKGSFKKMMEGIGHLKKHDVRFSMKSIVMPWNLQDLDNMREIARSLGAEYRFDTVITPRLDGGKGPASCRLDPKEMARLDIEMDFEGCEWIFTHFWNRRDDENLMRCGAGEFAFNVNPYGYLSPCTMFKSFQYSLRRLSFKSGWDRLIDDYGKKSNHFTSNECLSCSMITICPICPAAAELETGAPDKPVDHLCGYAKELEKLYFLKKRRRNEKAL